MWETPWESRSLPGVLREKPAVRNHSRLFFLERVRARSPRLRSAPRKRAPLAELLGAPRSEAGPPGQQRSLPYGDLTDKKIALDKISTVSPASPCICAVAQTTTNGRALTPGRRIRGDYSTAARNAGSINGRGAETSRRHLQRRDWEYDDAWQVKNAWVDFSLKKRNTGFEGLAAVSGAVTITCSRCARATQFRDSHTTRNAAKVASASSRRGAAMWKTVARIRLPKDVAFKDSADMATRSRPPRRRVGRNRRASGSVGCASDSGRSSARGGCTSFRERRKAKSDTSRSKESRGSRHGRSSPCQTRRRSAIPIADANRTSRFTFSESAAYFAQRRSY